MKSRRKYFIHKLSRWHTDVLAFWYNDGMATAHVTFQERAYLRRSGHRRLDDAFRECATLYNGYQICSRLICINPLRFCSTFIRTGFTLGIAAGRQGLIRPVA